MATTTQTPQVTDFSRDVLGRYVCNGLDEAMHSADKTARRPDGSPQNDARPFDVIVVGGGTFGSAFASHLFHADVAHRHRVLVLEGGPFVLTEHVQDLPMLGLDVAGASSIADLRQAGLDKLARNEVWGLAWHANTKFPGLAYCVGGRSLYWGGWSPRLLDEEMPTSGSAHVWPANVVADLNNRYFQESSEQIGVDSTNDFIFGPLQNALRQQLFDGLTANEVTDAIPLSQLPDHPAVRGKHPTVADLLDLLGLTSGGTRGELLNQLKIEAPLAVQTRTLSGLLPFNKFSSVPLLMQAARAANAEAAGDDVKKRLMIVPECHVVRLVTARMNGELTVVAVETNRGTIPVQPGCPVVVALGTIESTRLVLNALDADGSVGAEGQNLLAHLRSNLTIRIPRSALKALDPAVHSLSAGALIVKGRHTHPDGTAGHYHLQITAAGLGARGTDSAAELSKKIPDIDTVNRFEPADATHVVITIRGIGEMEAGNPNNRVVLDPERDEYGQRRAFVALSPSAKDLALWDAMDKAADDVAAIFGGGGPIEFLGPANRRDGMGTTHHEAGSLSMGPVTDSDGRVRSMSNVFVSGPAILPRTGSPNPMLSGIALARRLGDHLSPAPAPFNSGGGAVALFNGFSTDNWRMSTIRNQPGRDDPGRFSIVDRTLESVTGSDLGLYWCTTPTPADFELVLEWLRWENWDNSGVFVRFPNPESKGYNNSAFVAVDFGFEIQIDETGAPDGAPAHKTGAIYAQPGQTLTQIAARTPGEWNEYAIRVQGQTYTVTLNGTKVAVFENLNPARGLPSTSASPSYVGLQTHTGRVAFRNIRIKAI